MRSPHQVKGGSAFSCRLMVWRVDPRTRPRHRSNRGRDMDRLLYREGERITYQRRGGSWLAVSGYRNGDIFYRKSNLACRGTRWHIIELEYPREAKVPLDPIVTEIARRMGGHGTECG